MAVELLHTVVGDSQKLLINSGLQAVTTRDLLTTAGTVDEAVIKARTTEHAEAGKEFKGEVRGYRLLDAAASAEARALYRKGDVVDILLPDHRYMSDPHGRYRVRVFGVVLNDTTIVTEPWKFAVMASVQGNNVLIDEEFVTPDQLERLDADEVDAVLTDVRAFAAGRRETQANKTACKGVARQMSHRRILLEYSRYGSSGSQVIGQMIGGQVHNLAHLSHSLQSNSGGTETLAQLSARTPDKSEFEFFGDEISLAACPDIVLVPNALLSGVMITEEDIEHAELLDTATVITSKAVDGNGRSASERLQSLANIVLR